MVAIATEFLDADGVARKLHPLPLVAIGNFDTE
jgi:hypothetical protein